MLAMLHGMVGEEHLMLGSDYPYDMGEEDPLGFLAQAGLRSSARICGGNAAELLSLST